MNVVLIDIDSLRPDHIGAYGYPKPTTPNIDGLATDGVRFDNAYTANSPCIPSRAALLTGRPGVDTGVVTHGPDGQSVAYPATDGTYPWAGSWRDPVDSPKKWDTLPELFYRQRTYTAAVSSFPRHPAPWFHRSWHRFEYPQEPPGDDESFQTVRGARVARKAADIVAARASADFLLYAQYWDPHGPYNRSTEEVDRFRGVEHPYPTEDQIQDHQSWDQWRSAAQMGIAGRDDLEGLLAGYDAEIKYVDEQVGVLLDALRREGVYDDTLIVLTADHGEEFGEHGLYREHWSVHEGTQRVPLVIKPPATTPVTPGARSHLVLNTDIAPTVADYVGHPTPGAWQGSSLRPIVADNASWSRSHLVFGHGLYTAQRGVRTRRWKYVRTYHSGMWASSVPEEQLFDVDADPWEQRDRSRERDDERRRLSEILDRWERRHVSDGEDPMVRLADDGPAGYRWAQQKVSKGG